MTKPTGSLLFLFLFPLLLSFNSGGYLKFADGLAAQKTWCIARFSANDDELMSNIAFACNHVNCTMIQQGGPCFNPANSLGHASAAMNEYYAENGRNYWNCYFSDTGLIVITDPSYDNCKFA